MALLHNINVHSTNPTKSILIPLSIAYISICTTIITMEFSLTFDILVKFTFT